MKTKNKGTKLSLIANRCSWRPRTSTRRTWAEEDLDPIQRELRRPTLQYKPFEFMKLVKAPPPPAWRDDGGAWGQPVEAPPLPEDGAKREGFSRCSATS